MKFLCLAYGDEHGWKGLSEREQREVLAQDALIRKRGDSMSTVQATVTSVRNWDGNLEIKTEPFAQTELPRAGFSVLEADCVEEVIALVSNTPCARARGVSEIRPFWSFGEGDS